MYLYNNQHYIVLKLNNEQIKQIARELAPQIPKMLKSWKKIKKRKVNVVRVINKENKTIV